MGKRSRMWLRVTYTVSLNYSVPKCTSIANKRYAFAFYELNCDKLATKRIYTLIIN